MKTVLFIHNQQKVVGGIERYIVMQVALLKSLDYKIDILIDEKKNVLKNDDFLSLFGTVYYISEMDENSVKSLISSSDVKALFIHKIVTERLISQIATVDKSVLFVHDHDYYCPRHHKYYPITRKNCSHAHSLIRCGCCTMMVEKTADGIHLFDIMKFHRKLKGLRTIRRSVVLSHYMYDNLVVNGFNAQSVTIIPPPISLPEKVSDGQEKSPANILYLGQLIRGKGVDLLLRALKDIDPLLYHLDVVGNGNDWSYLHGIVDELHLSKSVTFHGWQKNPERFLQRASFSVVPSKWQEPYGLSGVEALAHALPVVGFDVGGMKDWLPDSEWGVLVLPENIIALRDAITFLLKNPETRKTMGLHGREFVKSRLSHKEYSLNIGRLLEQINE